MTHNKRKIDNEKHECATTTKWIEKEKNNHFSQFFFSNHNIHWKHQIVLICRKTCMRDWQNHSSIIFRSAKQAQVSDSWMQFTFLRSPPHNPQISVTLTNCEMKLKSHQTSTFTTIQSHNIAKCYSSSMVSNFTNDLSIYFRIHGKKNQRCITDKRWPNVILTRWSL